MINAQQILAELPVFARDSQWAGESNPTPAFRGPELGFLKEAHPWSRACQMVD